MTYEEFLKADFEEQRVEWVDGEIDYMGTVSSEHADLVGFLLALMRFYIDGRGPGRLFFEPFNMRLPHRPSGRNPDILFVSTEHADRIKKNYLNGPADLIIEVVSPDDRSRDLVVKRAEYEQAGVPEYWILDPERKEAIFLQLDESGHYSDVAPDADGVYHSTVMKGLWIRVDWLFRDPLPPLMDVLREWKMVP
jgi:Uma2 family endonuclease